MPADDAGSSETMLWCMRKDYVQPEEGLWRASAAEFVGTTMLVLLSCLPGCADASPLQSALAAGLVVTLVVQTFDHVSGAQVNPAVTLASALWARTSPRRALLFVAAQLAGASLGAALLQLVKPSDVTTYCLTLPAENLSLVKALALEALLGGCLVLVNCGAWDARTAQRRDSWPLRLGLSVAAMALVAGPLTGASMNPARSFGPALVSGNWTNHWVYWAGPLSGAALCAPAYAWLWRAPHVAPPACPSAGGTKHRPLP